MHKFLVQKWMEMEMEHKKSKPVPSLRDQLTDGFRSQLRQILSKIDPMLIVYTKISKFEQPVNWLAECKSRQDIL